MFQFPVQIQRNLCAKQSGKILFPYPFSSEHLTEDRVRRAVDKTSLEQGEPLFTVLSL